MKLVYTNPNRIVVENARNICVNAGIQVELQNEYAGGGLGELAPINTWLELWVVRDRDYERAKQLIDNAFSGAENEEWRCSQCGELNTGAFEVCWNCQQPYVPPSP